MKENIYDKFLSPNGANYKLVDYPGAERLRRGLYDSWLTNVSLFLFIILRTDDVWEFA